MVTAFIFFMEINKEIYDQRTEPIESHVNVGSGSDITIAKLTQKIAKVVGYEGALVLMLVSQMGHLKN